MKINQINELEKKRIKLINISIDIIIKNGWNKMLFNKISTQKKINSNDLNILFPNGYKDMLIVSLKYLNADFEKKFNISTIKKLPTHKRIKKIIMKKIHFINLKKEFYKTIFYHLLLPNNYKLLSDQIYKSVDSIWYIANDQSTDFNFYTKRIILAGIYTSTLFHFFNNNKIIETEKKLDRLLVKVSKIPQIKKKLISLSQNLPSFYKVLSKPTF